MGKKSRRQKAGKKGNAGGSGGGGSAGAGGKSTYVPDTSGFGPAPSPEAVAAFWTWFQANERTLRELSHHEAARLIDEALMKVHPDLCYELGGPRDGGNADDGSIRHLIVSAGGDKKVFNAVLAVIRAAPNLKGWRSTAFRDRKCHVPVISYDGNGYDMSTRPGWNPCPRGIRFALLREDAVDKIGVWIFFEGFEGEFDDLDEAAREHYGNTGFLYLDAALGEYDVEMHVGEVRFLSYGKAVARGCPTVGLEDLACNFDDRLSEKIGRKPKGGWAELAGLGCKLDVGGGPAGSPTSVACSEQVAK